MTDANILDNGEIFTYCEYVQECCPEVGLDFFDELEIDILSTNWKQPKLATDYNNVAVMALIAADDANDLNERDLYVEYAIEALEKGILFTDSPLCKAHLAIVHHLIGEFDKSIEICHKALSEILQINTDNHFSSFLGIIYLPRYSSTWRQIIQVEIPNILRLENGIKQAIALISELMRYSVQSRVDSPKTTTSLLTIPHPSDSYKIVIVISGGLKEFVLNTLISIQNCGISLSNVEIFTPQSSITKLKDLDAINFTGQITAIEDITKNQEHLNESSEYHDYGSDRFGKFTLYKWKAIKHTLSQGVAKVIYTDVDIAWRQSPIEILDQIGQMYDLAIQTEGNSGFPPHCCTGFMSFVNTEISHQILDSLIKLHSSVAQTNPEFHDQIIFNNLIYANPDLIKKIFFLSETRFACGLSAKLMSASDEMIESIQTGQPAPIIFHANWTVGLLNKKLMLQRTNNWFI